MNVVSRLLLREEIDALDHDLAEARRAETVNVKRIRELEAEIERLEDRYAASRESKSGAASPASIAGGVRS